MAALGIGVGLVSLDVAIANTALPAMAAQFNASPAASVWIVNIYQLAMVATLLPLAALGEIVGYRRVWFVGAVLFTVTSLACALSPNLDILVFSRLLQGLGASAVMSVNGALLRVIFPTQLLGRGFGTNALVAAIGFALGPAVASIILAIASWPWLFAINVPFGMVALMLGQRTLPSVAPRKGRFDFFAALCNVGAFGFLILALGNATHRASASETLAELAAGVLLLLMLLRRESGAPSPMLPVDLLRRPLFALSSLTSICAFATQGLALVSLPFYFETVLGRSPAQTGYLITPWAVLVGVMAPIAGRLSDRYPPGMLGGIGLTALAAGMLSLFLMPADASALGIGARMALCGIGFGFFQAPNLKAIMSSAPPIEAAAQAASSRHRA